MRREDLDPFFVGEASMDAAFGGEADLCGQLDQVFSLKKGEEAKFVIEHDLSRFDSGGGSRSDSIPFSRARSLFAETKKYEYEVFDFLTTKAKMYGDSPVRENDLVLMEEDIHILDYLKDRPVSISSFLSVASLLAYRDMGIQHVRYLSRCSCPVCCAFDNKTFVVEDVLKILVGGGFISHSCGFLLFPVIYREFYDGPIEKLNEVYAQEIGSFVVRNVPVEYASFIPLVLLGKVDPLVKDIYLVNMVDFLKKEEESDGVVVYLKDGCLYVHNSYVGDDGPLEFLKMWFELTDTDAVDPEVLRDCDTYFLKGRKVAKHNGSYWDVETGEVVR